MAHIVVYLQRTPSGVHPASALGVCVARKYATGVGATVLGVAFGDGSEQDDVFASAASNFGVDQILFTGPNPFEAVRRFEAKHAIAPHTTEGLRVLSLSGLDSEAQAHWASARPRKPIELSPVMTVVAGALPWPLETPERVDAEYVLEHTKAPTQSWLQVSQYNDEQLHRLYYVAPSDLDAETQLHLDACSATAVSPRFAANLDHGTLLWLDAGPTGLPDSVAERSPHAKVVLLPGPNAEFDNRWALADWVLPGAWPEAARQLSSKAWKSAL